MNARQSSSMKAIGVRTYGGPEVLHAVELPEPHTGPGEVRVRVRAAGVNPADAMLRDGSLAEWYRDSEPPFIPGMDVAGTLDEVADDVRAAYGLSEGEPVIGVVDNHGRHGGYSEYVVLPAASVTRQPVGTTFAEAASFLMNALTARSILDSLALAPGSTLVVTGASGAVGGYVVQLAAAEDLRVIAVASEDDEEWLRSHGADAFVARGADIAQRVLDVVPGGVDAVADCAMLHDRIAPAIRCNGRIAVLRFWGGDPGRGIVVHPVNVRSRVTDTAAITRLCEQVETGELTLRVAATFPADQAPEAHRLLEKGGLRGRPILEFPPAAAM
ncbi:MULTISPECIES: NADP-dependent oxidoreductase [unclassified Streptomyces]|uniref:NADP-dependent oxidoreductase n=1 Tax=unclassified Streptomyces TaxID=2593676 RepID=UPI00342F68F6